MLSGNTNEMGGMKDIHEVKDNHSHSTTSAAGVWQLECIQYTMPEHTHCINSGVSYQNIWRLL